MFKTKVAEQISAIEYGKAIMKAELLEDVVESLKAQVDRLQEALVAATAPRAYDSMQRDKANQLDLTPTDAQLKASEERTEEQKFLSNYLENLEKPVFEDADDLISSLGKLVGVAPPEPMHMNSEN